MTKKKRAIDKRRESEARYMIKHRCTERILAKIFHLSKSTIHKDLTYYLPRTSIGLYNKVREVLDINAEEAIARATIASAIKRRKNKD